MPPFPPPARSTCCPPSPAAEPTQAPGNFAQTGAKYGTVAHHWTDLDVAAAPAALISPSMWEGSPFGLSSPMCGSRARLQGAVAVIARMRVRAAPPALISPRVWEKIIDLGHFLSL